MRQELRSPELTFGADELLQRRQLEINFVGDNLGRKKRNPVLVRYARHGRGLHIDGIRVVQRNQLALARMRGHSILSDQHTVARPDRELFSGAAVDYRPRGNHVADLASRLQSASKTY